MNKCKHICAETDTRYLCGDGELRTVNELIGYCVELERENVELERENAELKRRVDGLLAEKYELRSLTEVNEQLQKDNRRMLILIAAMEKLFDVELTELI